MGGKGDKPAIKVRVLDLMCYTPEYDRRFVEALTRINPTTTFTAIDFPHDPQILEGARLHRDDVILDRVNRLPLPRPVKPPLKGAEYLLNLRRLARRITRDGTQVVHMQWSPYAHMLPFDHRFLEHLKNNGVKTVHTVHNLYPHDSPERQRRRYRRLYQIPDALICHTESAKSSLVQEHRVAPEKVWVIPHGPMGHEGEPPSQKDSRRSLDLNDQETIVLLFGNLRPYKGTEELLDAWVKVQEQAPQARLVIAGGGPEDHVRSVRNTVQEQGLAGSVRLELGWIDDEKMQAYHSASDILVYPYRGITQSGALVAGMRYGRPIVATRLKGFEELLEDQKTGPLVPVGDAEQLADALLFLIQDPKARKRQGRTVKQRWKQKIQQEASWDQVAKKTLECYQTLLQGPPDRM